MPHRGRLGTSHGASRGIYGMHPDVCDDNVRAVVFVEVKAGPSASLTPRERLVRDAVSQRRVEWCELRLPDKPARGRTN